MRKTAAVSVWTPLLLLVLVLLSACPSLVAQPSDAGHVASPDAAGASPDAGPGGGADASTPPDGGEAWPRGWQWTADPSTAEARVALGPSSLQSRRATLRVTSEAPAGLYGLGFRLGFDPQELRYAGAAKVEPSTGQVLAVAEPVPGLLAVGVSAKGAFAGTAQGAHAWLDLDFEILSAAGGRIDFVAGRSAALGQDGKPRAMEWRGGRLAPQ